MEYESFANLMHHSCLVLTDCGGQEEAPSLGKPVLVLRNTTNGRKQWKPVRSASLELTGTASMKKRNGSLRIKRLMML